MRIALISHLSEISGGTVALMTTAAGLRGEGHEVLLVLPGDGPIGERAKAAGIDVAVIENPQLSAASLPVWQMIGVLLKRSRYVSSLRRFLKTWKADIAYINTSSTLFPGIAARLAGVPVVWHIHETLNTGSRSERIKKRVIRCVADGLLYASRSGTDAFPPQKLPWLVVRNAIELEKFRTVREERQSQERGKNATMAAGTENTGVRLLLNGAIPLKGGDLLLDAAEALTADGQIANLRVTIAGRTDVAPEFLARLQQHPFTLRGHDRVQFPGLVGSMADLLKHADFYISASHTEAMPIAIVEAMAAGVPVIATDVGDCADLLDHGKCGWVIRPKSAAELAQAIEEAVNSPSNAVARAQVAVKKIERLYGGADFWKPLISFLEQRL